MQRLPRNVPRTLQFVRQLHTAQRTVQIQTLTAPLSKPLLTQSGTGSASQLLLAPLILTPAFLTHALSDYEAGSEILEEETGVQFPKTLSEDEHLTGVGVRQMGGLVNVYAIGLYVDPQSVQTGVTDQSDLCLDRTFRLVVVRQVAGSHMQRGFERGLASRVKEMAKNLGYGAREGRKELSRFAKMFLEVGNMKVGSEVRIFVKKGVVSVWIDGRSMGDLKSEVLAGAIVDLFLGEKTVTPTLRLSTLEGLKSD